MAPSPEAVRLARRLRGLRDSHDAGLTQSQLAKALSRDTRVAIATISSWESLTNPKLPPAERLRSYALFFCTDRTNRDGTPEVVSERELTLDERERFEELNEELIGLRDAARSQSGGTGSSTRGAYSWEFESGPITIICPESPEGERPALADERDPNYTRMYRYADLDALIELWGHLRASNPELQISHRLPSEVKADDMSGHLVVLGGIGWNHVTRRLLKTLREMPISQFEISDLKTGEIFKASGAGGKEFWPQFEDTDGVSELVEDVALLTRLRNPFNHSRTITICNGIHSRGVLGAVRTLTDVAVRERNEAYLSRHFPDGLFALLLRVPVVNGEAISPDLEIPENRLYQWEPGETVSRP
ncbi:XRE family transcriptional regulator [Streptomyces sp. SID13031]|uniref:XRE family transcriptional regulator n=1 Tax=Streptomyces sp. SID13031 TaxID=2706046 RepID=UPI0013C9737E|nr:XRE family transcriptional regulator [Streptomyces sp. SID13031]NEA35520.1 XRE family transcriptional regulator [Streptomyces sp. SID13031]